MPGLVVVLVFHDPVVFLFWDLMPIPAHKNAFKLRPKILIEGDIIYRVEGITGEPYSFIVLKNRRNVIHMFRTDVNKRVCTRYNTFLMFECVFVLRDGKACYTEEELNA